MKSKIFLLTVFLLAVSAFAQTQALRELPRQESDRVAYENKITQIRTAIRNRNPDDARPLNQGASFVLNNHPSIITEKGNSAQIAKAQTLYSDFYNNRTNKAKAEKAVTEYKKVLAQNISNQKAFNAVAELYDSLNQTEKWKKWVSERAENPKVPAYQRAEAYMRLASQQNVCANDITEMPDVKKLIQKDGKPTFTFTKPANPKDLETLKNCVQKGTELINKSIALDKESDSAWSYKTILLVQSARLAEMEGRITDKNRLTPEIEMAKAEFIRLAKIRRGKKEANDKDFLEAVEWINTSVKIKENFENLSLKANLLANLTRYREAIETGEKAIQAGKKSTPIVNTSEFENTLADWKRNSYVEEPPDKDPPIEPPAVKP